LVDLAFVFMLLLAVIQVVDSFQEGHEREHIGSI